MFKTPFYTATTYRSIIEKPYNQSDPNSWHDFKDILSVLTPEFIKKYENVSWQKVGQFISENKWNLKQSIVLPSWKQISTEQALVACKYMFPTLWHCDYFYWKIWWWKHHGIDIMLPKWTPLPAFVDWEIVRVKMRDGKSKNEWNCLVLKGAVYLNDKWTDLYFWYEHLDWFNCQLWDKVKQWDIVAFCWTTWNSTQFHLHLQIDYSNAKFHPFWSGNIDEVSKFTIDPVKVLRLVLLQDKNPFANSQPIEPTIPPTVAPIPTVSPTVQPTSKPIEINNNNNAEYSEFEYNDAIMNMSNKWLIKSSNGDYNPNWSLLRYEFALLLFRIIDQFALSNSLKNQSSQIQKYVDIDYWHQELVSAVELLQKYWIMKWSGDKFMPMDSLKWEQLIAVIGRTFYWLTDWEAQLRYQPHLDKLTQLGIIKPGWSFISKNILRKETFRILWAVLKNKWIVW